MKQMKQVIVLLACYAGLAAAYGGENVCGCKPHVEVLCANNHRTYVNECEMNCDPDYQHLYVVHYGACDCDSAPQPYFPTRPPPPPFVPPVPAPYPYVPPGPAPYPYVPSAPGVVPQPPAPYVVPQPPSPYVVPSAPQPIVFPTGQQPLVVPTGSQQGFPSFQG